MRLLANYKSGKIVSEKKGFDRNIKKEEYICDEVGEKKIKTM